MAKGYKTNTPEEKRKAFKSAWKYFLGEDDVIIGRDLPLRLQHYIWLDKEVRMTLEEIIQMIVEEGA